MSQCCLILHDLAFIDPGKGNELQSFPSAVPLSQGGHLVLIPQPYVVNFQLLLTGTSL